MGESDISNRFLEQLHHNINDFQEKTMTLQTSYEQSLNFYSNLMRNMLNKIEMYATKSSLIEMNKYSRIEAITQVSTLFICKY